MNSGQAIQLRRFDLGVAVKPAGFDATRVIHDAKVGTVYYPYSVKHDTKYV